MKKKKLLMEALCLFLILILSGCTENKTNNESNNGSNDDNWLIDYSPVHTIGSGNNDFWIEYPTDNPKSNQSISHLSWINDSLEEGCVLFVVHMTGCKSCQPQADRIIDLAEKYEEYLIFHDLDASLGGSIEQRAYDSYLYDPDGSPGIIALTGIFTLIENNGSINYAWHSWERDVDFAEMEKWVRDGIYYWQQNRGGL